jgi:hypothetical protein
MESVGDEIEVSINKEPFFSVVPDHIQAGSVLATQLGVALDVFLPIKSVR